MNIILFCSKSVYIGTKKRLVLLWLPRILYCRTRASVGSCSHRYVVNLLYVVAPYQIVLRYLSILGTLTQKLCWFALTHVKFTWR